jgi:hypothetical protein
MERGQRDLAALWEAWLRPWTLAGPLSGDVTQAIETSFIRVTAPAAGDPALERQIVEQVASYGRQLGRIIDSLSVLISHSDRSRLTVEERDALDALVQLGADIGAAKKKAAASQTERILREIRTLRRDPDANADALRRIRSALDEEQG